MPGFLFTKSEGVIQVRKNSLSLQSFLSNGRSLESAWLDQPFKVYVRKGVRWYKKQAFQTFELSNLPNIDGKLPRGEFRKFMETVEQSNKFDAIYIENVFPTSTRLKAILEKNGYVKTGELSGPDEGVAISYIKKLNNGHAYESVRDKVLDSMSKQT